MPCVDLSAVILRYIAAGCSKGAATATMVIAVKQFRLLHSDTVEARLTVNIRHDHEL